MHAPSLRNLRHCARTSALLLRAANIEESISSKNKQDADGNI